MHLINITLQKATAITAAVFGNFSAPKAQEIVVSRGKILDLLRPNEFNGKVQTVLSMEVFGIIRSLATFRLTGDSRDYLVVGSDSGRIVILQYNADKNMWDKIHQETFGKSGCRRIVPGQYLAVDPKGRAVLIGAVEKQKLVYILNRDSSARLTISSPLEAHKSHTIVHHITGVDVGFENPIFASIEVSYGDVDQDPTGQTIAQKHLTFYELDLGLNHVVRKWSEPIDNGANMLISVPGGTDGPGGVLICCENYIIWKNQGQTEVRASIPRRKDLVRERSVLIVATATHKQRDMLFFLAQSEYGDIYKLTLKWEGEAVTDVLISYFDTVPVANALCVLKTGFLFVASEFGNHYLYQFQSIGDETEEGMKEEVVDQDEEFTYFNPRPLKNLIEIDEIESLSPILDFRVADFGRNEARQYYALCGRSSRSALRILRHGLAISEMAVSPLPGIPNGVWTVKRTAADQFDRYIIVSFLNATLVLSIGETVEEVTDSGFLGTTPTLNVGQIGDDALVQIYTKGVRYIRADRRVTEWPVPERRSIVQSATNERQVVIALSGGEILYFELDETGQLVEVGRKDLGKDIACLAIAPIPEGSLRARFLAVGDYDNTVRILSLFPDDTFSSLAVQAVQAQPTSICILRMKGHGVDPSTASLFLSVGLANGVLHRTVLDRVTGELTDSRTRLLGARPVKLVRVVVQEQPALLALSSRPWLCYAYQLQTHLTPLSYIALEQASNFSSEQCPEGIVATSANTLRIISPERLGEIFNQEEIPLRYTPRKMIVHPTTNNLITIETDHGAYPALIQGGLGERLFEAQQEPVLYPDDSGQAGFPNGDGIVTIKTENEGEEDGKGKEVIGMDVVGDEKRSGAPLSKEERLRHLEELQQQQVEREQHERAFGAPKLLPGTWASCIRLLDPVSKETIDIMELDNNEAALSVCTCVFHDRAGEIFVIVGTAKDMILHPRMCAGGFLHVYRLLDNAKRFSLVHKTPVENVPTALYPFQGRLLVGLGKVLRIYDMGKRRLLRKCENKSFPHMIKTITTQGDRIVITDLAESFHFVKYRKAENQLVIFADDTSPRWVTASHMLDYDTMAGADKFGNVFICRVPADLNEDMEDNPMGTLVNRTGVFGAPYKLQTLINFHLGEIINSITKTSLVVGGTEALVYTTMMGALGALVPFTSREDIDFYSHLEMHMRNELPPLCGRDHLAFRSFYFPCKDVIDGDLCEQYSLLPADKQQAIAAELDRTPSEVLKKLEIIRNALL